MMEKRMNWSSVLITLLALTVVYTLGTTFFTIELERLVERMITPYIEASPDVDTLNQEIYSGIDQFMLSNQIKLIGYACVALMILLAITGFITDRKALASLGSIGFILPIYAYFLLHMSFLAGLGVLTALWAPFWGDMVKLGDIVYLPYMILVYPLSLIGLDIRKALAGFCLGLGLFVFILGVFAWFYARYRQRNTADFWIYRFTRHPQYLGWIIWSYGLMLRVAHRQDTVLHAANPGASLPWVLSTLIIICVAFSEEIHMKGDYGQVYARYSERTPFMIPLPRAVARIISLPFRMTLHKDEPTSRWDLLWIFIIYSVVIIFLSLPFAILDWPSRGWMQWPS